MSFCADAWAASAADRAVIDTLPFLVDLESGSLRVDVYEHYLAQDAIYLAQYARILAACSGIAPRPDEAAFWAECARTTVSVEMELHRLLAPDRPSVASPVCRAYTAYLWSLVAEGDYPVLVAGLLPCFWVYQDVGRRLHNRVGARLADHPFAAWVRTYDDPAFEAATRQARAVADRAALEAATRGTTMVERMTHAFLTSVGHEREFWRAAYEPASL